MWKKTFAQLGIASLLACGVALSCDSGGGEEEEEGEATGSTCPPASTLTYENFGKPFMEQFCTRCHDSALKTAEERQDAPLGHDFDTSAGIELVAEHIDENAAAGPNATNRVMPPSDPKPTDAQRHQLGEWLACLMASDGGTTTMTDAGNTSKDASGD